MTREGFDELVSVGPVRTMRVELGPEAPAPQPDPLGRMHLGWRDGLTPSEVWRRGRGVWRVRATDVIDSGLLLITFDSEVQMVGTIDSIVRYSGQIAVVGEPLPDHRLIGREDPLVGEVSGPIAYGVIDA